LNETTRLSIGAAYKALISFAAEIATDSELPVLDAGCGFGRNELALSDRSAECADRRLAILDDNFQKKIYSAQWVTTQ
jgi:hypothetical protein